MKIKLIILLALLVAANTFAQVSGTIKLTGNQVTIESVKVIPITGESNVWEIEPTEEELCFQLLSGNADYVVYTSDKKNIKYIDNNNVTKETTTIPCKKRNGQLTGTFFQSAQFVINTKILPVKIFNGNTTIAEFRVKEPQKKYQEFSSLERKEFLVGDKIEITPDSDKGDIPIKSITVYVKKDHNTSKILQDGIITEECLNGKDSILRDIRFEIRYKDDTVKEEEYKGIKLKKTSDDWSLWIVVGICAFALLIIILLYIIRKNKIAKPDTTNKIKKPNLLKKLLFGSKRDEVESPALPSDEANQNTQSGTDVRGDSNLLGGFTLENRSANQDSSSGTEVVIETLNKIIKELEDKNKQLESSLLKNESSDIGNLRTRILELESSEKDKLDEIDELSKENSNLKEEIRLLQEQMSSVTSDNASKKDLRKKIDELNTEKNKVIRERQNKERELIDARKTITALESKIKEKDDKISEINKQKDEAESKLRIEKNSTAALQNKINSFSKQTHYLFAIDDAMQAVDNSLKHLFTDVRDENLMKRLAQPVLSGTAGLDAGLESYLNEWKNSVYDNQKQFFGDDVLNMSDNSVKEKLAEFLEQLALRDSFGKLVRLYLMTNVGWINEKMVVAGFNVDAIQTLFARFKNLFTLFNIEISYPRLFVDKFDSNCHKDNMRCEIFNYFEPSEELLAQLKMRENENLIVDVTRIGIPNSKTPARRNAMVSLPNF